MKTLVQHLVQYATYHREQRNIYTHFVGIPMIVLAIAILLSRPTWLIAGLELSAAWLLCVGLAVFYLRLHLGLGLLMSTLLGACVWAGQHIAQYSTLVWLSWGVGLFVLGWIIQFVGHFYEGRKPAFLDDIMGLAVGPLFVVVEGLFVLGAMPTLRQQVESQAGPVRRGTAVVH